MLIEYLREQQGKIELTKNNIRALAFELRCETQQAEDFINTLLELELIKKENNSIFSKRLNENINHLNSIREKRKSAAKARWDKSNQIEIDNANAKNLDANANNNTSKCTANAHENDAKKSNSKEMERKIESNVNDRTEETDLLSNSLPLTSDLPLPLITDYKSYFPSDWDNDEQLKISIKKMLSELTVIPDVQTISSFFNIISKKNPLTKQVKKQSSFKILFDICSKWNSFAPDKKNFGYLYKTFKGKIQDQLTLALEQRNSSSRAKKL